MYPGGLEIYQDRMPLYINCTEVTHVYTNGSYQLVYQNCTPLFVHTKQVFDNLDLSVHSFSRANSKSVLPVTTAALPFFFRSVQWAGEVGRDEDLDQVEELTNKLVRKSEA